jgi:hypothetical protein
MSRRRPDRGMTGLERAYAVLLQLYPAAFRREYGGAMLQAVREMARDGGVPLWRKWLTVLADVSGSVVPEHLANPVVRTGTAAGLVVGVAWTVYNMIGQGLLLRDCVSTVLNDSLLPVIGLACAAAGFAGSRQGGTLAAGVRAAVLAAAAGSVIGVATMWIVVPVFYANNFQNPAMLDDFRRSGMASMDAFIVRDALGASLCGPTLCLLAGTVAGAAGSVVGRGLRPAPS